MKTSNKVLMFAGILAVVTVIVSIVSLNTIVHKGLVKGNGIIKEKEFVLEEPYDQLSVDALVCELIKANENKVVVSIDENLIDKIIVKVEDGELIVSKELGAYYSENAAKVQIYYKDLKAINVVAAGEVEGEIMNNDLSVSASAAGELNLHLDCKNVAIHLTSGAEANLIGKCTNARITGGSGAEIDAKSLMINNCVARIGSGMDVDVSVSDTLVVDISSGADLTYFGNPFLGNVTISSGGDLNKGND